ncbi:MAG: outer membrane beta-barrel protein, partial [Verrucomicrobiota bacterium]
AYIGVAYSQLFSVKANFSSRAKPVVVEEVDEEVTDVVTELEEFAPPPVTEALDIREVLLDGSEKDGSNGFQVYFEKPVGETRALPGHRPSPFGWKMSLGYHRFSFSDVSGLNGELDVIRNLPNRSILGGRRDLEAKLIYMNLGPYINWHWTERFYARLGAGITAGYLRTNFGVTDVSTQGAGSRAGDVDVTRGRDKEDGLVAGAYVEAGLGFHLSRNWSLVGGMRYQYLDNFDQKNGGSKAELDFDSAYEAYIGLSYRF